MYFPDKAREAVAPILARYGYELHEVRRIDRRPRVSKCRKACYRAVRDLTRADGRIMFSMPQIGRMFDRCHTTVLKGLRK